MYQSSRIRRLTHTSLLLVFCLLLIGCGKSKVTKANYEKIKKEMTLAEVEAILGKGTKEEGGDGSNVAAQFGVDVGSSKPSGVPDIVYVWEKGDKKIMVILRDGKVVGTRDWGL